MKTLRERVEIEQAFLDGKPIQFDPGMRGTWVDVTCEPRFAWDEADYRVKLKEPLVFYQALCVTGDEKYYIADSVFSSREDAYAPYGTIIRLLTENPIHFDKP